MVKSRYKIKYRFGLARAFICKCRGEEVECTEFYRFITEFGKHWIEREIL